MVMKIAELLVTLRSQRARDSELGQQRGPRLPPALITAKIISRRRRQWRRARSDCNCIWWRGNEEKMARWFAGLGPAGLGAKGGALAYF